MADPYGCIGTAIDNLGLDAMACCKRDVKSGVVKVDLTELEQALQHFRATDPQGWGELQTDGFRTSTVFIELDSIPFVPGVLELLLRYGFKIDQVNNLGVTGLMWASVGGSDPWLIALLEAGANPNLQCTRSRMTSLHRAAFSGQMDAVCDLLRYKADVTILDSHNKTALDHARLRHAGMPEMTTLLLQAAGAAGAAEAAAAEAVFAQRVASLNIQ